MLWLPRCIELGPQIGVKETSESMTCKSAATGVCFGPRSVRFVEFPTLLIHNLTVTAVLDNARMDCV